MMDNKNTVVNFLAQAVTQTPLEVAVVQQAGEMMRTKKASVPGSMLPGIGFSHLNMTATVDRNWYLEFPLALEAMLETAQSWMPTAPPKIQRDLSAAIGTLRKGSVQKEWYGIHIHFRAPNGHIYALFATLSPSTLSNGLPAYLFAWGKIEAAAQKSIDYMAVIHTKSNWLSEKTTFELRALPQDNKGLTKDDTSDLLHMIAPFVQSQFRTMTAPASSAPPASS